MTHPDSSPNPSYGHSPDLSYEDFRENFQKLMPLIRSEWPQLAQTDLLATDGDLERSVSLIANHTEHTRTLVRHHLAELLTLAAEKPPTQPSETRDRVDHFMQDLETRTDRLIAEFKAEILPELEQKARSNIGSSLLIALGFGFILGLLFGGRRG